SRRAYGAPNLLLVYVLIDFRGVGLGRLCRPPNALSCHVESVQAETCRRRSTMRDLIIIGGGAAGLSAAMYALGKQLDFLIIYETFGKAGTAQHLIGQAEEEYLAGSEAVRQFERRISIDAEHTLRDQVTEVTKASGVFQVATRHHGVQQ